MSTKKVVSESSNVFLVALSAFASLVTRYTQRVVKPGVNISNWSTQLVSNAAAPDFSFSAKGEFGEIEVGKQHDYMPCASKRDADNFVGLCRSGNIPDIEVNTLMLLGYLVASMVGGKMTSTVNVGRGVAILELVKALKLSEFTVTLHDLHLGGVESETNPKVDKSYPLSAIKLFATGFAEMGKTIEALPLKSGKASKVENVRKVTGVKFTPKSL